MKTLIKILSGIDRFSYWQGEILSVPLVGLIVIIIYDITARQFGLLTVFLFDTEWFLYSGIMMVGMGVATLKDTHVRIDWITDKYSPRTQEIFMAISWGLIVLPCLGFISVYAWKFLMSAFLEQEKTVTAWHVVLWPVKSFIFTGIVLMIPQVVAQLIRSIYFVIKQEELK